MKLHDLTPGRGSKRKRKRLGRGPGSGTGTTCGRGTKGQKSRSGHTQRPGFEGGQMPLIRRVPKRGFTNVFRTVYTVVNIADLAELHGNIKNVTPELLVDKGLARRGRPLKVLGDGELDRELNVAAHKFSATARSKIEKAGGSCEELPS